LRFLFEAIQRFNDDLQQIIQGKQIFCTYFCASSIVGTARNLCIETWLMPNDASHAITIPTDMPQNEFLVKGLGSMLYERELKILASLDKKKYQLEY